MWKTGTNQPRLRRRRILTIVGVIALAAIAAFFIAFEWNWLKSPIENAVTTSTGRRFEIQGDLTGEWRLRPRVRMTQVKFANPAWAKNPLLISADAVELRISLLPLLRKRVHILRIDFGTAIAFLERLKDGRATWLFDREQRDEAHDSGN